MPARVRNAYVGMFDILGFKALRAWKGTAGVAQLYERSLLAMVQHAAAGAGRVTDNGSTFEPHFTTTSAQYRVISDTVMFFARGDDFISFFSIVTAAHRLLQAGFANGQTPFRGAIGYGDLYDSGEVTVGSAIEDAHLGESSQLWAGAMLTEAAEGHARDAGHLEAWKRVHEKAAEQATDPAAKRSALRNVERLPSYEVPLKAHEGARRSIALDWTPDMFEGAVEKALPLSTVGNAARIRENTIRFEKWARARRGIP